VSFVSEEVWLFVYLVVLNFAMLPSSILTYRFWDPESEYFFIWRVLFRKFPYPLFWVVSRHIVLSFFGFVTMILTKGIIRLFFASYSIFLMSIDSTWDLWLYLYGEEKKSYEHILGQLIAIVILPTFLFPLIIEILTQKRPIVITLATLGIILATLSLIIHRKKNQKGG